MQNIKLLITYDGTHYLGWQKTKMGPSIEQTLENALKKIFHDDFSLQAASRTDAGVHAEEQVVNFFLKKEMDLGKLKKSLNALLPKDISILDCKVAPLGFHPTLNTLKKEYHYYICYSSFQLPFFQKTSWHFPYSLDVEKMQQAAFFFLGSHDFSAFCNKRKNAKKSSVREIYHLMVNPLDPFRIQISIIGNFFLYKMVRNLVGTLVYIGAGKMEMEALPAIFKSKDRKKAGVTAPAHGLFLKKVFYKDSSF